MSITLHNLRSPHKRTKKRVGRGSGSGIGTYSGRGIKGQKARTGGRKGLTRLGVRQFLFKHKKHQGFRSLREKMAVINIGVCNDTFQEGDMIHPTALNKAGLLNNAQAKVKILGKGNLQKKFTFQAHAFSQSAKKAIQKVGGKIEILKTHPPVKNT